MIGEALIGDSQWRLRFGMKALCSIEEEVGKPLPEVLTEMKAGMSFKTLHLLVWAGLLEHHNLDKDAVYSVIDDCGLEPCGLAVGKALESALPKTKASPTGDGASAGGKARARKAGTG
jgi:hypothetical protein